MATATLSEALDTMTRPGELYKTLENKRVECFACGHRCRIAEGQRGVCKVRYNRDGVLYVPWNYTASLQVDPIEKKPFFHVHPGSKAMSFGMLGCDLHCSYCQNWITSQALRDPVAGTPPEPVTANLIVNLARKYRCSTIVSTYNEPLITSEWAVDVMKPGHEAGFHGAYVSNGNATPEVLEYLHPYVDFYKVDLKTFNDKNYRRLGCKLQTVLDSIGQLYRMNFWVEIVTLLVPGFNSSDEELRDMARFIVSISADIPWHITAFHQDYKMREPENTEAKQLIHAAEIGSAEGLHFVYAGNLPGQVGPFENTRCPNCSNTLVRRYGFYIEENRLREGRCPDCQTLIPGHWEC